ncbi:MAG: protein kinase [Myxococcales bacterium]|nr:protein kinase [Myxococcales bacterium]
MESGQFVAGKYRLNKLLGTGGMAEVWSATNTFTERQLAIKFLNRELAKTPDTAARFLKEAKVSARINHPNIIDILDVGQTDDGTLFLVMELLTGFPLEVALRRQRPSMLTYEFVLVMIEVAQALAAAHKSGIVHRDLKPTNVFLHKVRDGVVVPKLLDFGVSKFLEDDVNHALTIAGTVLGSPLYMSPEQARGDSNIDGRTDVFAFGAILFEALCGYRAYEAKNFNALIVKIATTPPKNIDECAPEVPEPLRRVVRACMEPRHDKRIDNFEEIVEMLRAAAPHLEGRGDRLPTPPGVEGTDPDATNALPVMRPSDRPPVASSSGSIPPGASIPTPVSFPPGAVGASLMSSSAPSWQTPNTSYASVTVSTSRKRSPGWLVAGAAITAVGVLVGAGVVWQARGARGTAVSAAARTVDQSTALASARAALPAPPPPSASSEPPVVNVDALPVASSKAPTPNAAKGHLLVSATPGWCNLSIDGAPKGPTPITPMEIAAGPHALRCETSSGKVHTATVQVPSGATAKHRFALDH